MVCTKYDYHFCLLYKVDHIVLKYIFWFNPVTTWLTYRSFIWLTVLTFASLSVWSRHIARSRIHSVRQKKRGRGGHQRPEWSKAAGCRRAHHREVRQQPQSEDGTGPAYPALPDSCSPLHRPSAPPDPALQVLLPPAAHTPTAPYSSSDGFPLNRSAFTPSGGFRQITTGPTEAVLNFNISSLLRDKTLHVNQPRHGCIHKHSSQYSQSVAWGLCKQCVSAPCWLVDAVPSKVLPLVAEWKPFALVVGSCN